MELDIFIEHLLGFLLGLSLLRLKKFLRELELSFDVEIFLGKSVCTFLFELTLYLFSHQFFLQFFDFVISLVLDVWAFGFESFRVSLFELKFFRVVHVWSRFFNLELFVGIRRKWNVTNYFSFDLDWLNLIRHQKIDLPLVLNQDSEQILLFPIKNDMVFDPLVVTTLHRDEVRVFYFWVGFKRSVGLPSSQIVWKRVDKWEPSM